jgi:hypothetical protein
MVIVCFMSLLLSVAVIHTTRVNTYSNICLSPNLFPTVTGTPLVPSATQPSVVLNEVLLFPNTAWNCAYQTVPKDPRNAWIELYNLRDQPVDLYAARTCIDTGPNTTPVCLALGSIIPPHSFFTIFPAANNRIFPLTASPSTASMLRLLLAYTPVDQVNVPALPPDISYARLPDGTGKWQPDTAPTINSSNTIKPSPSPTPTPHHQKKASSKTKNATTKNTRIGNNMTMDQLATATALYQNNQTQDDVGKQTQWQNLQFPDAEISPSALSTIQDTSSTPPSSPNTTENVPQKVLYSLIGVAVLLSLWWAWQRFLKKTS